MSELRIIFLGTNGWYSTDLGNTICTLVETKDFYIVLDCGNGFYKIDRNILEDKPILIFLSHLHLDHIIGLHTLSKFNFSNKIVLFSQIGSKDKLRDLFDHPFSTSLSSLPINLEIVEIEEGKHKKYIPYICKPLLHSDPTLGFRFELNDKIISYCTDTGMHENLFKLARSADLFISECSYKPGQERWGWPHLRVEEAAKIAKESNCQKLILTHFDASYYDTHNKRIIAEQRAKKIFPSSLAAYDDFEINI